MGPRMDTDAHGLESELTERVIGSAFEIANVLGEYLADHVVEEKVIVELKRVERFANAHLAQCINYLKALWSSRGCLSEAPQTMIFW